MIKLSGISTLPPPGTDKEATKEATSVLRKRLAHLQHLMYAEGKYSLLVIFQGMDASGKDGATRRVFGACRPSGVSVMSFKKPTEEEFAHDFLWRVHRHTPAKGMIQVFNRSHYEDVLIQRVHQWISEDHARKRIQSINAFEELLQYDNNTIVLKFYLHISREKQKEELQERIDDPEKHWKHNPNDWREAKLWDKYMHCYEEAINQTTLPWHIIPVDKRWYRDYCILNIVVEALEKLDMELPDLEDVE